MQKTKIQLPEIKLAGITCRTSNKAEIDPQAAKIGHMIQKYFNTSLYNKIAERATPGNTYCVYTNYESDFTGEYTYFIGEEVTSFNSIATEFETLVIPPQLYTKFTTGPGKMPDVCISAWQEIWQMPLAELGGSRGYIADFELYDERSMDPQTAILDIYIGLD